MLSEGIEIAIKHGVKIVPILLGQPRVPANQTSAGKYLLLQRRHAIRLDPDDFVRGVDRLAIANRYHLSQADATTSAILTP